MTKRMPFGSRDPNVRSGDSVSISSSIPSIEEALRQKRKKRKKMASVSSSNTPLISNRSKPPRYDGSKQLRRLKQSMATREQQLSPGKVSSMASAPTTHTDGKTASVKRKGHSDDGVIAKKRLKASFVDIKHCGWEDVATTSLPVPAASTMQGEAKVATKSDACVHAMPKLQGGVEIFATKRPGRNVAAEYLHNHRDFKEKTPHPELLMAQKESTLHLSARSEGPVGSKDHFEGHTTEEAMMDCTSDEESLNLSVSPASSSSKEDVEEDNAWVLMPPTQPQRRVPVVETEKMEFSHESGRRYSMTTPVDDSRRTPRLDNGIREASRAKSDSHRGSEPPIATKDMLAWARESKPDNKVAVDAMLNSSGRPYKGTNKQTSSPHISVLGKTIDTLEGSQSLSGSEVTLLSPESLDLQMCHKSTKRETTSDTSRRRDAKSDASRKRDAKSDMSRRRDAKSDTSRRRDAKSEDTRENSQSSTLNELNRISTIEHGIKARAPPPPSRGFPFSLNEGVSSIRQPEPDGVHEGYRVGSYKHNNVMISVMIPHPPLPSGWAIRISESKQLLVYSHPDFGTSWHCPVIMSQHSTEMIRSFLSQFFGHTEAPSTDQETESERSEMSHTPPTSNVQEDYASESGSQTSLTSASSAGRSQDTAQSVAKSQIVDSEGETGSELSLLTHPEVGVDSPMRVEKLAATVPSGQDDSGAISTSTGHSQDTTHDVARRVTLDTTGASSPELSPSSNGVAKYGFSEKEEATTEERSSPMEVEELVFTVQFSRSESGTVIPSHTTDDGEEELIHKRGAYGDDSKAFVPEHEDYPHVDAEDSLVQDDDFDVDMHDAHVAESAVGGKLKTKVTSVDSRLTRGKNGVMPALKPLSPKESQPANISGSTEAESVEVDQHDHGIYDEDAAGQTRDEGFEAEIDNVVFGYDHEDVDLSPQAKRLSPIKGSTAFYSRNEDQDEAVADLLASEHGSPNDPEQGEDGVYDDDPVGQSKYGGFEAEVSNLGEVDNLSPIQQSESFDNGIESLLSNEDGSELESEDDSAFDKPLDASPSRKDPIEHNALGHHDREDDNLSIASSLTGMTTRGDSRASKWRGFSHRVLHPPCPLCSLVRIEDLVKAAIARMKQRKAEASRKSFRKEKRDIATRLVFA